MADRDLAAEVVDRKTRSLDWLKNNYYSQWEQVFKAYKCVRDPALDENGKEDLEQISIALPMTYAHIRRNVARATAQIPNLKFRSKDPDIGNLISRTLMYQWDRGGVQRQQKRHMTQALLFGTSIRSWYWAVEEYRRSKRVDPMDPNLDPQTQSQIADEYKDDIASIATSQFQVPPEMLAQPGIIQQMMADPQAGPMVRAKLLELRQRGGLLPLRYDYRAYVGPKCDFLFIGDCYFQPNFQSLQTSQWFIVERRRDKQWLLGVADRYPDDFGPGILKLLNDKPNGDPQPIASRDVQHLRERMLSAIGQSDVNNLVTGPEDTKLWTITEQHVPGTRASLTYVGADQEFLGRIPYPYDLDGKIAFTELIVIDDLLCGLGDSTARIIQPLQDLQDGLTSSRMGLIDNLLRPLIGTTNQEFIENPGMVRRHAGFRLVKMRGPGDMWVQGEQAAMAAAAAGLQDESSIMRHYQLASGESNMSMAANVDPQQARTATGARLMAYNQDVLTKDLVDMFNETSIKPDAEMMFLLNRSEMGDAQEFDASSYNRGYNADQDMTRAQWMRAEPQLFQTDGEITAEVGSTLADDDEAKVSKAMNLWQAALTRPDLINPQKARDELLIAMGKGRELQQWAAPPPPEPQPEIRGSVNVAAKWELLSAPERMQLMQRMGIQEPPEDQAGAGGPPPPPNGAPPVGQPASEPGVATSAYAAAKGQSPFSGRAQ